MGMTKSKQVSEPALVADPAVRDDRDTATTFDVSYVTTSRFITQGAGAYPNFNFLFAGQDLTANVPNIPDSDFTITQYTPWVVNNNMTEGFLTLPSTDKVSRNITNQDAGGANIVISYTPRAESTDPTQVNFVQAFIE